MIRRAKMVAAWGLAIAGFALVEVAISLDGKWLARREFDFEGI